MSDSDELFFGLAKLQSALPSIVGKPISDVVILTNPLGRAHLFLVFTDGTHYEFYDITSLRGGRWSI